MSVSDVLLMDEIVRRLDRIEQLLREIGRCDRCGLAHRKGQIECEQPVELRAV